MAGVERSPHPYMTSSAGCWQRYGELLAAQYADQQRMAFHQLVVDTYAVQHPGAGDARAIQSVGIHLMTLSMFIEQGTDPSLGTRLHRRMAARSVFHHLSPPTSRGTLTVLNVAVDGPVEAARRETFAWARDVWGAWEEHHRTVRQWLTEAGFDA